MASRPEPDFQGLIARVARALLAREIPFMLIGGQAVLLHGEPRLTQDVDVTLEDAAGVVRRKGSEIDWDYVRGWAAEFAKVPGREQMIGRVDQLEAGA